MGDRAYRPPTHLRPDFSGPLKRGQKHKMTSRLRIHQPST
jgi:hypothetical protein